MGEEFAVPAEFQLALKYTNEGKTCFILLRKEVLTFGRSSSVDIVSAVTLVSRNHCNILYLDGNFYLQDADSSNGTKLNGIKIRRWILHRLKVSDMLEIPSMPLYTVVPMAEALAHTNSDTAVNIPVIQPEA
jgi:pSer/pThr/pTyr-binding forkhead associated (FHA) protein